ncbi:MAG: response regulator [Acidobacteriota bacterium]
MNPPPSPRILIVDDDETTRKLLTLVLTGEGFHVIETNTGQDAYTQAVRQPPDLAILDVMLPGMDGYTLCRRLRQNPATASLPILMLTCKDEIADKIAGFEAGANDYIIKPFHPKELAYRVKSLLVRVQSPFATTLAHPPRGRTIAVFSAKGGVGKTLLSTNLAIAFQQRSGKRVALFDADFYFGNVGVQLNLPPGRSILDLIPHIDDLEPVLMDQVLAPHTSGVRVLMSPFRPEQAELITPDHIRKVMKYLSEQFAFVLVDCQANYEERTLAVLESADDILLIVTPEIGPLKNMRLFFEVADKLGLDSGRFQIVLNRFDSNVGIKPDEIEHALQRPIQFRVGSGGRPVVLSTNRGIPIVFEQPNYALSQQIFRMAEALIQTAPVERRSLSDAAPDTPPSLFPFNSEA